MASLLSYRPIRRSAKRSALCYAGVDGRCARRGKASEVQGLHAVPGTNDAESTIRIPDQEYRKDGDRMVPWQQ